MTKKASTKGGLTDKITFENYLISPQPMRAPAFPEG